MDGRHSIINWILVRKCTIRQVPKRMERHKIEYVCMCVTTK